MVKAKELTIEDRIRILHEVIDGLKGSTHLQIDIHRDCIDVPGTGWKSKIIPTGETLVHITAYDPKKDKRSKLWRAEELVGSK